MPASPWASGGPGPGSRRRAAAARAAFRHSRRARLARANPAHHAPEPDLGRGYNLLGIPLAAGAALPGFHILLTPVAGRRGHGAQLGLRAGQQPSAARLATFRQPRSSTINYIQSLSVRILTRYILGEILSHTLIGCALFTFILFMKELPHILEMVVRNSSTFSNVC
jgi:hypothetical protein